MSWIMGYKQYIIDIMFEKLPSIPRNEYYVKVNKDIIVRSLYRNSLSIYD